MGDKWRKGLSEIGGEVRVKLGIQPIILFILVFVWLMVNGEAVLGPRYFDRSILFLYALIFLMTFEAFKIQWMSPRKASLDSMTVRGFGIHVVSIILGVLVSVLILFPIYEWVLGLTIPIGVFTLANASLWAYVTYQLSVIVPIETLAFQYMWPLMIGPMWAQVAFAAFHWGVTGGDLNMMAMAMLLGLVWVGIARSRRFKYLNVSFVIGSHFAYNMFLFLYLV